jgi:integrase
MGGFANVRKFNLSVVAQPEIEHAVSHAREQCLLGISPFVEQFDRIGGKGNKIRCLPLASDTVLLLGHYLRLERPQQCGSALFVSLKGPARGARMTPAGMRSLFRHHRRVSQTAPAHPHRFRLYATGTPQETIDCAKRDERRG